MKMLRSGCVRNTPTMYVVVSRSIPSGRFVTIQCSRIKSGLLRSAHRLGTSYSRRRSVAFELVPPCPCLWRCLRTGTTRGVRKCIGSRLRPSSRGHVWGRWCTATRRGTSPFCRSRTTTGCGPCLHVPPRSESMCCLRPALWLCCVCLSPSILVRGPTCVLRSARRRRFHIRWYMLRALLPWRLSRPRQVCV